MAAPAAGSAIKQDPQLQLTGERIIDDPELESLLEEREQKKQALSSYSKAYKTIHDAALGRVKALDLPPGRTRCGGFVIVVSEVPAKVVSFETQAGQRIRFQAPKAEE